MAIGDQIGEFTSHKDIRPIVNAAGNFVGVRMARAGGNADAREDVLPTDYGRTATAGGGQASAVALVQPYTVFTTVATLADSAKLPASSQGQVMTVTNAGAASMNVFPATGEAINALSANTAFAVAAGKTATFMCGVAGQWFAMLSA